MVGRQLGFSTTKWFKFCTVSYAEFGKESTWIICIWSQQITWSEALLMERKVGLRQASQMQYLYRASVLYSTGVPIILSSAWIYNKPSKWNMVSVIVYDISIFWSCSPSRLTTALFSAIQNGYESNRNYSYYIFSNYFLFIYENGWFFCIIFHLWDEEMFFFPG